MHGKETGFSHMKVPFHWVVIGKMWYCISPNKGKKKTNITNKTGSDALSVLTLFSIIVQK